MLQHKKYHKNSLDEKFENIQFENINDYLLKCQNEINNGNGNKIKLSLILHICVGLVHIILILII